MIVTERYRDRATTRELPAELQPISIGVLGKDGSMRLLYLDLKDPRKSEALEVPARDGSGVSLSVPISAAVEGEGDDRYFIIKGLFKDYPDEPLHITREPHTINPVAIVPLLGPARRYADVLDTPDRLPTTWVVPTADHPHDHMELYAGARIGYIFSDCELILTRGMPNPPAKFY